MACRERFAQNECLFLEAWLFKRKERRGHVTAASAVLPRRDKDGYLSLTDFLSLLYPRRRANQIWATRFRSNHSPQQQQQQLQQEQQHQQQQAQQHQEAEEPNIPREQSWTSGSKAGFSDDELAAASLQLARPSSQLAKLSPRLHMRLPAAEETILQLKWERKRRQRDGRRVLVADQDCCCVSGD
ncbi:hypothetical protein ACSSS7_004578 [Eimeria intestinalis]